MDEQQSDSWRDRWASVVFLHHPKSGIPQVKLFPWQHLLSVDECRKESPDTVMQTFCMVLVLSSGLVGLEIPHFMELVPRPGLLWHRIRPVHSDLRAEKDPLSWRRSPKLPAAHECPSITCLRVASQCPSFLSLCDWGSCKTMKTLFVSYWPPTLLLPQPPFVSAQCPITLHFLEEAVNEAGVTSSLWAVAADLLGCYL